MNDLNASQDVLDKEQNQSDKNKTEKITPSLLNAWGNVWQRVKRLGLSDIAMRVGTALVTLGLVGLIIWVMKGFFLSGEMASDNSTVLASAAGDAAGGGIEMPAYSGAAPVEGLSRSAEAEAQPIASARSDFIDYTVVSGDTIWDISQRFSLDPASVLLSNPDVLHENPAAIYPGQQIRIPPVDGVLYYWHEGDGLNGVAAGLNVTPEDILNWPGNRLDAQTIGDYSTPNIAVGAMIFAPGGYKAYYDWSVEIVRRDKPAEALIWGEGKCEVSEFGPVGTGSYVWPTSETRISGYNFDPEINHWGIDIGGKTGNPIYTVDHGVVVYAGWSDWGYGNVIAVDHGETQSIYAHLDGFNVSCGDFVYQGDLIGFLGNTGNSSGPHLHFELRSGSTRMNPNKYLTP